MLKIRCTDLKGRLAHINTRYSSSILPRNAFAWTSDSASIRHSTLQFSSVRMAICAPALLSSAALHSHNMS